MMDLEITDVAVVFRSGERVAGRYVYSDEYKPYLHPLKTPAGHTLSLASPHDHKHHKGLMYALSVPGVNFWEERSTLPGEVPGRQRHDRFRSIRETGDDIGFDEDLTWLPIDGGAPIFRETRTIGCRDDGQIAGFVWTWATTIEALRDVELTMSQWSARTTDGRLVNYHGLGIRFRREFGCTGGNRLLVDDRELPFADGTGMTPRDVEFQGSIDETWPVQRASVRIRQHQANGLFVMQTPFAFMGVGPSNLGPVRLQAGDRLVEQYEVTVRDLDPR